MTAFAEAREKYIPKENSFYRDHYHHVLMGVMGLMVLLIATVGFVMYQMTHRPLPVFTAYQKDDPSKQLPLIPYTEPNLLPETIIRWASKAATLAYTFDYNFYKQQLAEVKPYFTSAGWQVYVNSVERLLDTIIANRILVNGVVSGTPVISNQGPLPGRGYTWRVQIPFLVTYYYASGPVQRNFYVVITIVRVPTSTNPQGIGIDQFVMVQV